MVRGIPITAEQSGPVDAELARARPYAPSWVDRLTDWVGQLPVPAWTFYLGLGLAIFLPAEFAKWYDGTLQVGEVYPFHVVFDGVTVFMLAVIPFLDGIAGKALQKTRPALSVNDAEYARLHFELTVAPARPMLVANSIAVLAQTIAWLFLLDPTILQLAKAGITPSSRIFDVLTTYVNLIILSAFLYHTIHQLRQVRRIYASRVEVNLFHSGPLHAFSTLTGCTAVALIVADYTMLAGYLTVSPILMSNPISVAITLITTVMAVVVFAWPLLDLHSRMNVEKQQLLDKNAREMEAVIDKTHRQLAADELQGVGLLKDAVDTLVSQRAVLEKLPSWPWQAATVRGFGTALLLPILLWFVQRILERLLSF